ncbi:hypothetical protein [Nonomuraea sp. NPDC050310]|uniref:hypothetical protein n=1 Tax=Nonomuraea sp. NPDC050310 TaxID=3154935 RepID=UPI0033FAB095
MVARIRMDLKWKGGLAKARSRAATMRGLERAAEHLYDASQELVPTETLALKESGTVSSDASQLRAAVSYDTEWAVWQHEDPDLEHEAGERSKYLERPFNTERDELRRLIAAELGQELG